MKIFASSRSRLGAALITTLVFTALLLAMSAAILSWSTTETRLNRAHSKRLEARNAAEALIDYGAAQAVRQIQGATEYSSSFCDPTSALTTLAPTAADAAELFTGTNIDPATIEVVGKVSAVNTSGGYVASSADPRNAYTLLPKDLRGKDGRLELIARASTLPDVNGRRQSLYMRKTYTILDAPVLQYAAFYNMDLEVAPGPAFNIYGPVHTNANLWVSKQSSSSVYISFWEAVSAYGYIRKGFKVQPIMANGAREVTSSDPIRFMKTNSSFESLYGTWGSYTNVWRDQFMGGTTELASDFRAFANATYGDTATSTQSSLQTSAHGVKRRPLPGQLDNYVEDPNPTDGIISPLYRNVPRALIERPLYNTNVELIGQEVEMQKMSRKAGLYIIVNASGAVKNNVQAPDGTIIAVLNHGEYRAYARNPSSTTMVPTYTEVKLPGQKTVGTNLGHPWVITNGGGGGIACDVRPLILVRDSQMTDMRRFWEPGNLQTIAPTYNHWLARSGANTYNPKRLNLVEVDMTVLRLAVDYTVNGTRTTMMFPYDANWGLNGTTAPFTVTDNTDSRYRSTYRSIISQFGIDSLFTTPAGLAIPRDGFYTHIDDRYDIRNLIATRWDGSIYIEVVDADFINTAYAATDASAPIPTDVAGNQTTWRRRKPGHRNSGVRLINGRGPIASADAARLANTAAPCSPGLTLSTNDALYIFGHLNADGRVQVTTVSPTTAQLSNITVTDESSSGNNSSLFRDPLIIAGAPMEQPLALVADAITILSNPTFDNNGYQTGGWCDALSHLTIESTNWLANWSTSPGPSATPAGTGGQRDGVYTDPGTGNKHVFEDSNTSGDRWGQLLSPMQRYLPGSADPNPRDSTSSGVVANADTRPSVSSKFTGATTEISAGFIIGLSPSENNPTDINFASATGDGNNSGGLHNLPRFLEKWSADCAIRGSMVVMFESKVAWEPFNLRVYGPPGRQWGFHNYFRNFYFSDDIPATRNVGTSNADRFEIISRSRYLTDRTTMWGSPSVFTTPPP